MAGEVRFWQNKSRYWLRVIMLSSVLLGLGGVFLWPRSNHVPVAKRDIQGDFETFKRFSNITLNQQDSYSCGPGNPCSNGACCGSSGYCGYGPIYCGEGCVSNCDAVAECGQYAKVAGQTCPLNTCCSQYGFCGTTEEFCGKGCQSNCVLHPEPPGGGAGMGILQNKVIGYYESWSAPKACHKVTPVDLPLDALTHVNFAFASIDSDTYQVVPMDSSTPSSLFKDTANLKSIKKDLSVWVTIGGWAFSDNGTATQPLFGKISRDASLRQTFANNVVHFMRQYGFDGLDLDWEYPGAPDRCGSPDDTANYVLLLKTLRETFGASGSKFGLTFTTPTSYWYLRWFDLPNMARYADWINVMTYDLHGSWDANNPIGNIVQGHTNLTEIKLAMELYWRVNIPPSQLVLGFGFYGRSFTLSDPNCNSPGCAFSRASNPGPCSATAGILAYYEIQELINQQNSRKEIKAISPIHDRDAAVKYFTFGEDQWVSYDDKDTFKQKVDWANSVGMGGAMIWASDLGEYTNNVQLITYEKTPRGSDGFLILNDRTYTDKYSAHSGLVQRSVISNPEVQDINKALADPIPVVANVASFNGQKCFAYKGNCVNLNDNNAMSQACGSGFTVVGWDDAGCGKKSCHCGKPICCPSDSAPKDCKWRGDNTSLASGAGSDCSAQCEPGEININHITSSWGGGFTNDGDTDKCGRGEKAFCCPDSYYASVDKGCSYAKCGEDCPAGTSSVLTKWDQCWKDAQKYCCPNPVQLTGCHWVSGSSGNDCANAICNATEIEIDKSTYGDRSSACDWGRSRAGCCTITEAVSKRSLPAAICSANPCDVEPNLCKDDPYAGDDDDDADLNERTISSIPSLRGEGSNGSLQVLDTQKRRRSQVYVGGGMLLNILFAAYPSIGDLFGIRRSSLVLREAFWLRAGNCADRSIKSIPIGPGKKPGGLLGLHTEHPIDLQVLSRFVEDSSAGVFASGRQAPLPPVAASLWRNWDVSNQRLGNRPPVGVDGATPSTPNDRIVHAFGSTFNPSPFLAVDSIVNIAKGSVMGLEAPTNIEDIRTLAEEAVRLDSPQALDRLLSQLRVGFAVFDYMRLDAFRNRWVLANRDVTTQMGYIESDLGIRNLEEWWTRWSGDYYDTVGAAAQNWARRALAAAMLPFLEARQNHVNLAIYDQALAALHEIEFLVSTMLLPPPSQNQSPPPW